MSGFRFHDIAMLNWLWLTPLLAILFYYAARKRRDALARFADSGLLPQLNLHLNAGNRFWKATATVLAAVFLVVGLARPAWNRLPQTVKQRGRDVVFLLDVSRSMLAEDLAPNRLDRAKLAIMDAVDKLEGDRVALAVFAGAAVVKCPLTLDYGFFRMALDDVSPLSVTRGGTLIGDALRKVAGSVFDQKQSQYRDVVLITDGEDHESFPVEAAKSLGELQVRLIAIGLGDENVGKRIPITGPDGEMTFLQFNGREVWSKLDAATLREMVNATPGGRYLNVSTGAIDLGDVYRQLIASAERQDIESRTIDRYEEKFQVFLAIGFLLLAIEMLLRERKPRRERKRGATSPAAAFIAAALLSFPSDAPAASVRSLVNEGNDAYRQEAYEKAIAAYEQAAEQDPDSPYAALNRGNALYRSENFGESVEAYERAVQRSLDRGRTDLEAGGRYNLGNALYKQGEQLAEQNPRAAIDLLGKAVRSYKDAFRLDRGLTDAAHNVEIARRLIRQLREKAAQQQQQQGGKQNQDSNEERKSDLQKAADKQKELAEKSKQLDEDRQQNQDAESRRRQQQQSERLAEQQEDLRKQTEQMARDAAPQTKQHLDNAAERQQQAQEELEQVRPGQAEEPQRQAAEELQQAADSRQNRQQAGEQSRQQTGQQQQPASAQPSGQQQQPQNSAKQAMTAADILDKEKRDKRARQALLRTRTAPVEKDW